MLFADKRPYFRYQNGVMVLVEPSLEGLTVVSSFKLPTADQKSHPQCWPHVVEIAGKLYVRDQTKMFWYDIKATGK